MILKDVLGSSSVFSALTLESQNGPWDKELLFPPNSYVSEPSWN